MYAYICVRAGLVRELICRGLATNLAEHFDFAVTAGDAGAAKPHAAPFWHAAHAAGCRPAGLVHVGDDAAADLAGALAAGCRAILVTRRAADGFQSYDVRVGDKTADELQRRALPPPDPERWREVGSLAEAVAVIEEWRASR